MGITYGDSPPFARAAGELKAVLTSRIIPVGAEFGIDENDFSTHPAQNANAALRFQTIGVTHVLFVHRGGSVSTT